MTIEEKLKMYREKKAFVAGIASIFSKNQKGHAVEDITYEVWYMETDHGPSFAEWIIITFKGGAKSPCVTSGNSNSANFRAIAEMVEGGYYNEVAWYDSMPERNYRKVNLAKMVLTEAD